MVPHFEVKETGENVHFEHPTDDSAWALTKHMRAAMLAKEKRVTYSRS